MRGEPQPPPRSSSSSRRRSSASSSASGANRRGSGSAGKARRGSGGESGGQSEQQPSSPALGPGTFGLDDEDAAGGSDIMMSGVMVGGPADAGIIRDWDFVGGDPGAMQPSRESRYSEDRLSSRQGGDRRTNHPPPARPPAGVRELQPIDYPAGGKAAMVAKAATPVGSGPMDAADPLALDDLSGAKKGGVRLKQIDGSNAAKLG